MAKILILGGYGNFGKRIAMALARHGVSILIAGRNGQKGQAVSDQIRRANPACDIAAIVLDAENGLDNFLTNADVAVVVNTCGPFQSKDYHIPEICIRHKKNYIDLADGRDFVCGIGRLDADAKAANICVISGASTVPGLSSAVVENYRHKFSQIDKLIFGISPGQKAERGLATTAGILSYIGKPLRPVKGEKRIRYGWQDLYRQKYPVLGYRWMANCDIPDLDLFPDQYGIKEIRFSAGMENALLHLGIWGMSWLVRFGLPVDLKKHAAFLLRASHWFDRFGSDAGGMHVIIKGRDLDGKPRIQKWFILAKNGDGPQIPCVPAILLAKKLAQGMSMSSGAKACVGLVTLTEYLEELKDFAVTTFEEKL